MLEHCDIGRQNKISSLVVIKVMTNFLWLEKVSFCCHHHIVSIINCPSWSNQRNENSFVENHENLQLQQNTNFSLLSCFFLHLHVRRKSFIGVLISRTSERGRWTVWTTWSWSWRKEKYEKSLISGAIKF